MPHRKGYRSVKSKSGKTYMAPKSKSRSKKKVRKLGKIYAGCRSSPAYSADTPENKSYCARVAHAKSGA